MQDLIFRLPIDPPRTTAQEKGVAFINGRPHFYEKSSVKEARKMLKAALAKHKPEKPFTGAIEVVTVWCYDHKGRHKDYEAKTTKPDVDNMVKLLLDVMTGDFWEDDRQIVKLTVMKRWNRRGEIFVGIQPAKEGEENV